MPGVRSTARRRCDADGGMGKAPLFSSSAWREYPSRVRVEFVAFAIAIVAAFLFRAESFDTSMGPDELSLLVMAKSIIDGAFLTRSTGTCVPRSPTSSPATGVGRRR